MCLVIYFGFISKRFSSNKLYVYVSLFPDPRSRFLPDLYKSWASYLVPLCLVGPENGRRNPGKARADGWTGDVFHFEIYPRDLGAREAVYLEPGEDYVPQPKENRIVCLCLGVCHRVVPQLVRGCSCLTPCGGIRLACFDIMFSCLFLGVIRLENCSYSPSSCVSCFLYSSWVETSDFRVLSCSRFVKYNLLYVRLTRKFWLAKL